MHQAHGANELRRLSQWRCNGESIALVPTMGNLHPGHLALLRRARQVAARVVVSIYVNPLQFGPNEDYQDYPRTLNSDLATLAQEEVDLVFTPNDSALFPHGTERHTQVRVPELEPILCGRSRPGHFSGVATLVTKLFNLTRPDYAVFGEKDYQQLLLIRRLVADLCLPIQIFSVPTVRATDGLALSSRNHYLGEKERKTAARLYPVLTGLAEQLRAGCRDYARLEAEGLRQLQAAGMKPEYLNVRDMHSLDRPGSGRRIVLAAVRIGRVRLIDNLPVES